MFKKVLYCLYCTFYFTVAGRVCWGTSNVGETIISGNFFEFMVVKLGAII